MSGDSSVATSDIDSIVARVNEGNHGYLRNQIATYTDFEQGRIVNDPTVVNDAGNEAKGKKLNDKIEKGLKQEDSI